MVVPDLQAADPPAKEVAAVELVGQVSDFWYQRTYATYYCNEDFSFLLKEDSGKTWRIISRELTPAYEWRMGPTYPGLKVDWQARPRVKVLGVNTVDRLPPKFYDFKLDEPNLATALIVWVEAGNNDWKPFYINNWFHRWGDKADAAVHKHYADRPAPHNIYGFVRGQTAPFTRKSQEIIEKNKSNPSLMFHGLVRATKDNPFGYEIELLDLIGRKVETGGSLVLHGDAKTIPLLDNKK
jgi:hypothetical protein